MQRLECRGKRTFDLADQSPERRTILNGGFAIADVRKQTLTFLKSWVGPGAQVPALPADQAVLATLHVQRWEESRSPPDRGAQRAAFRHWLAARRHPALPG